MSNDHDVVSAEFVSEPLFEPTLFKGRPWVIYYERSVRQDGKREKSGMHSFETERAAAEWAFRVGPAAGLPSA